MARKTITQWIVETTVEDWEEQYRLAQWRLFAFDVWYRTEVVLARSTVVLRHSEELLARLRRS